MAPRGVASNLRPPIVKLEGNARLFDLLVTNSEGQPTALVGRSCSQHRAKGERGICVSSSSVKPETETVDFLDSVGEAWLASRQIRQELCGFHGYLLPSDVLDDGVLRLVHLRHHVGGELNR